MKLVETNHYNYSFYVPLASDYRKGKKRRERKTLHFGLKTHEGKQ